MNKAIRRLLFAALVFASLLLSGCSPNVGVGLSVGIPVGNHGYISVGGSSNRWY
jgi:predicted small secreted protein